jgi:predicted HAD superfamily Cof-like phosphohydrolase
LVKQLPLVFINKKILLGGISMTEGLDKVVGQVKEFHTAFFHPVADKIQPLALERGINRAVWTGEEALVEFIHQSSDNEEQFLAAYDKMIAGLEKAKAKSLGMEYNETDLQKVIGQSDAIVDAFYFLAGTCVEIGIQPQALFNIVQAANMAKLGPDGKPILRESDGKIMKPEGWEPPEAKLEEEIKRQLEEQK